MRILHICGNLDQVGIMNLFYDLCSVWARDKNSEHIIISFRDSDYFDFDKLGIPRYVCPLVVGPSLPWRIPNLLWRALNLPRLLLNMRRKIKTIQPDIIKAWGHHVCFYTHLTASAKFPQIWGIHSETPPPDIRIVIRLPVTLLPKLQTHSRLRKIIFVSNASMKNHLALGYTPKKATLIHNGVDTKRFHPSQKIRADKRRELGIEEDDFLIGHFGRFNYIKNIPLLANIFAEVSKKHAQAKFVLVGPLMDSQNAEFMALFSDPIFQGKVIFLGQRRDIAALFNALDCFVLTSHSETGPLVLLEAAACGVPAITTNVGDVKRLILDKQFVIDSGEVEDFVAGIEKIMAWQDKDLQQYATKSRQRVQDNFSIETTAEKYMDVFRQVLE